MYFKISWSLKSIHLAKGPFWKSEKTRLSGGARGHSYPDYQRSRRIKLARQSDLISSGMARKPLFVSSAYFRKPKRF